MYHTHAHLVLLWLTPPAAAAALFCAPPAARIKEGTVYSYLYIKSWTDVFLEVVAALVCCESSQVVVHSGEGALDVPAANHGILLVHLNRPIIIT